jgi:hypothetical protein
MQDNDRITIRDAELRTRLDAVIEASGGLLTLSGIIRAALEEKLSTIEAADEMRIPLRRPAGGKKKQAAKEGK